MIKIKAAMKGQTYGKDVSNTQKLVPNNSATASEFLPNGTYFLYARAPKACAGRTFAGLCQLCASATAH